MWVRAQECFKALSKCYPSAILESQNHTAVAVQSVKKYKVDRTDREDNGIADLTLAMVQSTLFHDSKSFL